MARRQPSLQPGIEPMINSMAPIHRCRVCGNAKLETVLDLGRQALTGRFSRPEDPDPLSGPLELVLCHMTSSDHCGLLQLRHSYPLDEMYGPSYGYRSSNNATMVRHLRAKIDKLVRMARPAPDDCVLDIGCNDGTTLGFYQGIGLRRFGIDPSSGRFASEYPADVSLFVDFFSADKIRQRVNDIDFKIITSIAMFYDLEDPLSFMRDVASLLAKDGLWEFEQHYIVEMLKRCAYDSVCHEHISYYGLRQLKWMTDRAGLKIVDITTNDINGGSISVIAARRESSYPEATQLIDRFVANELTLGLGGLGAYEEFSRRVAAHKDGLRDFLSNARAKGKVVVGYGASTKGNVVLQYCGITPAELPCIAEKYPAKFGLVTPGTRIPIVSETDARRLRPDYMLVLPWYFRDEIVEREAAYRADGGRLIFVLPDLEQV